VLEIGVDRGGSLRLWKTYFGEGSRVVGLDVVEACRRFEDEAAEIFVRIGSQSDPDVLRTVVADFGPFDLIYVAGLYDYLAATTARRLTRNLFALLTPGGRLLVANFLPNVPAVGYMESYMAWHLLCRTGRELAALADEVPPREIASTEVFEDPNGNIVFLLLTKP